MGLPMTISIEFWHIVGYFLSFLGFCFAGAKLLLAQYDNKLDEKFKMSDERLNKLILSQERESEKLINLERQLLRFQAEMPIQYVRREDYVRGQTVVEAKLDALACKLENLKGN